MDDFRREFDNDFILKQEKFVRINSVNLAKYFLIFVKKLFKSKLIRQLGAPIEKK